MTIADEFDYRNAKAVLQSVAPGELERIYAILQDPDHELELGAGQKQRSLSSQIKQWFANAGWKTEQPAFSVPGMRYDLLKSGYRLKSK
ncbi:MAG: hypothetical protein WBC44_11920 [Planctomycetaceae bacterium]